MFQSEGLASIARLQNLVLVIMNAIGLNDHEEIVCTESECNKSELALLRLYG